MLTTVLGEVLRLKWDTSVKDKDMVKYQGGKNQLLVILLPKAPNQISVHDTNDK